MRTIATTAALAATAVAAVGVTALPAAASPAETDITVVHGLNLAGEVTVDVLVDGELGIEDFGFGDIAETSLSPGNYEVTICLAGACDESLDAALLSDTVAVGDVATTLVAQFDEGGLPGLVGYVDDRSPAAAGEGVLAVRHAAAAGPVDVAASGTTVITGLANGSQEQLGVPAGGYDITTSLDGTVVEGLSVEGFEVREGVLAVVYAVGSAQTGYELLVDEFDVGTDGEPAPSETDPAGGTPPESTDVPTAVPAGEALVGPRGSGALWLGAVLLLLAAATATGALALRAAARPGSHRG